MINCQSLLLCFRDIKAIEHTDAPGILKTLWTVTSQ